MRQAERALGAIETSMLDALRSARSAEDIRNIEVDMRRVQLLLAIALFTVHLVGRAQIWTDVQAEIPLTPPLTKGEARSAGGFTALVLTPEFEPLPFDEAIQFFRAKTNVTPSQFAALETAARAKAFSVGDGAQQVIRDSIRDLLDRALADGMTLNEFQRNAADVLDRAGVTARSPWYFETVYRTNLQTSYQAGRWKQMNHPDVVAARPFLRYVSARLPTSRPSHVALHGIVKPVDDPFWDEYMVPNGFNCLCTVTSVSESLLDRRGWSISDRSDFAPPDEGFDTNPGKTEDI